MSIKRKKTLIITLIGVLVLALVSSGSALASEGNEIEIEGTVVGMDPQEKTIDLEVEGEILVVKVAGNFDFETINLGDLLEVKGTVGEDGTLVLSEYKIQDRIRDRVKLQDGDGEASFCVSGDKIHPVADSIAQTYGISYEDILSWFCGEDHVGLGQIMLALQTAALSEGNFEDYLADREDGFGWGQIWQELGEKGKPDHGTPPGQIKKQDGENDPEEKIPPGQKKKNGEEEFECVEELALLGLCELETFGENQKGKNK